jgi:hypothetical protein
MVMREPPPEPVPTVEPEVKELTDEEWAMRILTHDPQKEAWAKSQGRI